MNGVKNALVEIFWLMLASVAMILVWLTFVISALYVSFAVLGALFFGTGGRAPGIYLRGYRPGAWCRCDSARRSVC